MMLQYRIDQAQFYSSFHPPRTPGCNLTIRCVLMSERSKEAASS